MSHTISESALRELKKEIEALEHQFRKSKKELDEICRERKKVLASLIKKAHRYISTLEKKGDEQLVSMKNSSEFFIDAIDTDFDFSYTEFDETSHDIHSALREFEKSLKSFYKEMSDSTQSRRKRFEAEIKLALTEIRSELQQRQAFLTIAGEKPSADLESWKAKRLSDIEVLRQKIEGKIERARKNAAKFKVEVEEAYETLTSAMAEMK